jgi:hypothetical protein
VFALNVGRTPSVMSDPATNWRLDNPSLKNVAIT